MVTATTSTSVAPSTNPSLPAKDRITIVLIVLFAVVAFSLQWLGWDAFRHIVRRYETLTTTCKR